MENNTSPLPHLPPTNQHADLPSPPPSPFLHAVRKPATKPWRRPKLRPPRVYRADPRSFRHVVQRLTGAPRQITTRPHEEAGPAARLASTRFLPPPSSAPSQSTTAFVHSVMMCASGGTVRDSEITVPASQSAVADPGLAEFLSPSLYSAYLDLEFFPSVESGGSGINGGL